MRTERIATSGADEAEGRRPWWRGAVIYEIYPRSFADSDGDGNGDVGGIRSRLPYLADLGVDAIWIAPWYPSPLADGGYDVSDYCHIAAMFGTLDDADALLRDAHDHGIRVIIDLVANHTSKEHPWFRAARRARPGSAERDRYFFRDGRGDSGEQPPNNWISAFGGPAWTRTVNADGTPGQWYLHTFAPEQPDLDWRNESVRDEFDRVIRFWLDRGVDGFRVDAAPAMAKQPDLPDAAYTDLRFASTEWVDNPHWDVDDVHHIFRRWRAISDSYDGERVFVGEAVVNGLERLSRYVRRDELHTTFNFQFLNASWDVGLRDVIDATIAMLAPTGAPPTWVLSSHDETRLVTRYGRPPTGIGVVGDDAGQPSDLELGTRRARAAALLMLALPGGAYIYQGQELGLPEVTDLPEDRLQDPIWRRSGHTIRGRDGCRVPLPWSGVTPPFGFGPAGSVPWLPQPEDWASMSVESQLRDEHSTLTMFRRALSLRRHEAAFRSDAFAWREAPPDVLDLERGDGFRCVVNLSDVPTPLDPDCDVLVSSADLDGDVLPTDVAVWLGPSRGVP